MELNIFARIKKSAEIFSFLRAKKDLPESLIEYETQLENAFLEGALSCMRELNREVKTGKTLLIEETQLELPIGRASS